MRNIISAYKIVVNALEFSVNKRVSFCATDESFPIHIYVLIHS